MSKKNNTPVPGKKRNNYFDYSLLFIIIFLLCFGFVMLYSTSSYNAQIKFQDSAWYLKKQVKATAIGALAMAIVAVIDYRIWKRFAKFGYILSLICISSNSFRKRDQRCQKMDRCRFRLFSARRTCKACGDTVFSLCY